MNYVSIFIIFILIISAIGGFKRGLIDGLINFVAFIFSFLLSLVLYKYFANYLALKYTLGIEIAKIISFLAIIAALEIIFSILSFFIVKKIKKYFEKYNASLLDNFLGIIPTFFVTWVILAITLIGILTIPVNLGIKQEVQNSKTSNLIIKSFGNLKNKISDLFASAINSAQDLHKAVLPGEEITFQFPDDLVLEKDYSQEKQMLELINQERIKNKLPELKFDDKLAKVARGHSKEMFEFSYFDHVSPITGSPADRINNAQINYLMAGENLAYAPDLQAAHDGLMNSPEHRDNILSKDYTYVGIGIITTNNWGTMYTQNFIK